MPNMELDKRISVGNIIVLAGMVVSASIAWANISTRTETLADSVAKLAASAGTNDGRIRALEQQQARQDERLAIILSGLTKIEVVIDRLAEDQRAKLGIPATPNRQAVP